MRNLSAFVVNTLKLDYSKQEVISYGLTVLAYNLLGIVVVLLISVILKSVAPTVAIIGTLVLLRPSAGGVHCNNSFNCAIVSYLLIPPLGLGARLLAESIPSEFRLIVIVLAFIAGVIAIANKAPFMTQEKPRARLRKRYLRDRAIVLSVLVFAASLFFSYSGQAQWSMGFAAGLFFQCFMLIKVGVICVQGLDALFSHTAYKMGGERR